MNADEEQIDSNQFSNPNKMKDSREFKGGERILITVRDYEEEALLYSELEGIPRMITVKRESPVEGEIYRDPKSLTFFMKDEGGLHTFGSEGLFHNSLLDTKVKEINLVFFTQDQKKDETQWRDRLNKREFFRNNDYKAILWKLPPPIKGQDVADLPLSVSEVEQTFVKDTYSCLVNNKITLEDLRNSIEEIFSYGAQKKVDFEKSKSGVELFRELKKQSELLQLFHKGNSFMSKYLGLGYFRNISSIDHRGKKEEICEKIATFSIQIQEFLGQKNAEEGFKTFESNDLYLIQLLSSEKLKHESLQTPMIVKRKILNDQKKYILYFKDDWERLSTQAIDIEDTEEKWKAIRQIIKGLVHLELIRSHWQVYILFDLEDSIRRNENNFQISLKFDLPSKATVINSSLNQF
eukprot:TRINITY_DN5915_c0_g1_i3.p1 TRINITY_DN5915_c0_g1~~TRINITY_DN5915_c0_g1_i3.p1  ORF type:complete len:408 (-),score=86.35 TRINITY_DN5915_c0_g1_i3:643-1866(-)